ncbi:hypothetical protein [Providencia alcalifaciens]|uniref:hypothetical protein n=1 Tax=Providencia alcalifaciens TaxID=126385 RepID=UPI0012B55606|nr:hypothetical protein [Providencia alcalifaciens]MTC16575.1 hypothetical protein [Providencia alcalifaciens]
MKFKVGDKVRVHPLDENGTVYLVDDNSTVLPYLIEDEDGQTSWWPEEDLELINETSSSNDNASIN